jgi:hypothetical protein
MLSAVVTRLADTVRGPRVRVTFAPGKTVELDAGTTEPLEKVIQRAYEILYGGGKIERSR